MKSLLKHILILILCFQILPGCLEEDDNGPSMTEEFETNALILRELEGRGAYLNTRDFPSMLDPDVVYKSLTSFDIVDVRKNEQFRQGFIPYAVNVNKADLFDYVTNISSARKVLIVSSTGQASAYYNALFRLYGLKNTYSLKFGMAGWNSAFANEFNQFIGDRQIAFTEFFDSGKKHFSLPKIDASVQNENISNLFNSRIKELFNDGFNEILTDNSYDHYHEDAGSVNFGYLFYNKNPQNIFIMTSSTTDIVQDIPAPRNTVIFHPFYGPDDFYTTGRLQTIPAGKLIACYSYSGQISAETVALLKILGYNAKSILFGVQNYRNSTIQNTLGTGRLYIYRSSHDYPIEVQ